jgi:PRC-barrel domain
MMRATWISAASVLALLAAPALAQTSESGVPRNSGSPATMAAPKQAPDPLKQEDVSQIKGAAVYGGDNRKIGSISTVLMRPDSHQIDRLVVGAGGVLGVGAHRVALPVDQFRWDSEKGGFKISKTEVDLETMPAWVAAGADREMSGSSAPPPAPATSR